MYSSTVSTASTIQTGQGSDTFSIWQQKLEEYARTRKYFEPEKIIDENFIFNLYKKPILIQKPNEISSQPSNNDKGPICKIHEKFEDDIIKFWSENYFSKDTSTFLDRILNKKHEEDYENFLTNFKERNIPWYMDNQLATDEMPYIERFYCYPKLMASLGHSEVDHKKILEYIDCGIRFFHLDFRFGPMRMHSKSFQHLNYARKYLLRRSYGEAIFGSAIEITGRNLITGLIRNNQKVFLEHGASVILTADRNYSHKCNHRIIYINFFDYIEYLELQDIIQLGNYIKLEVIYFLNDSIECKVIHEGLLESNTQVILPIECSLKLPIRITHEEEQDIYNAFELECDFLICPCVYYAYLIQRIRWLMAARNRDIKIIARINLTKTFSKSQLRYVMKFCQGVWLESSNIRDENQKMFDFLIRDCFLKNKIIIRSGAIIMDNLSNLPSDEDKMKNIFLYPDCLAVSVDLINVSKLKSIISRAYPQMNAENLKLSCSSITSKEFNAIDSIFVRNLIVSCLAIRATCVIVINNNGKAVLSIAQQRPLVPIIASFCRRSIARTTSVLRNVYPVIYYSPFTTSWSEEIGFRLNYCLTLGKMIGCISRHEPFLFVFESKEGLSFTDTYRFLFLDDLN